MSVLLLITIWIKRAYFSSEVSHERVSQSALPCHLHLKHSKPFSALLKTLKVKITLCHSQMASCLSPWLLHAKEKQQPCNIWRLLMYEGGKSRYWASSMAWPSNCFHISDSGMAQYDSAMKLADWSLSIDLSLRKYKVCLEYTNIKALLVFDDYKCVVCKTTEHAHTPRWRIAAVRTYNLPRGSSGSAVVAMRVLRHICAGPAAFWDKILPFSLLISHSRNGTSGVFLIPSLFRR